MGEVLVEGVVFAKGVTESVLHLSYVHGKGLFHGMTDGVLSLVFDRQVWLLSGVDEIHITLDFDQSCNVDGISF